MKILRKGKVKDYKRIQVGDRYIGKCWLCDGECLCERFWNGHTGHSFLTKEMRSLFKGGGKK